MVVCTQFTYLTTIKLHESGSHKYVITRSFILSGQFKNGASRLDSFSTSREMHVANVALQSETPLISHTIYHISKLKRSGVKILAILRAYYENKLLA